jgi:hypothetical protein
MIRLALALFLVLPLARGWPQTLDSKEIGIAQPSESKNESYRELPDAPGTISVPFLQPVHVNTSFTTRDFDLQSRTGQQTAETGERYHWKGLLLQSFAFDMLSNATRVITADQSDRHLLLNKPYWSDYWASLQQFNMHRWNDGDSIKVNYIGHPMEGAIAGYIEVQNDPRGRDLKISRGRPYWNSRFRAFLWQTVYSTQWEMGPIGETAIFNQGGFTYPIGCPKNDLACDATAKYTNNTGWVDFIITPIAGTLWMIGEDAIDRYISDPLVRRHPDSFGIKMVRASLNPPSSLANILRGHFPWWRDYEHIGQSESQLLGKFEDTMDVEPKEHADVYLHYSALALGTNTATCIDCRNTIGGAGIGFGFAIRRYFDITADFGVHPNASPGSSLNVGGSLTTANFGIRSGYSGEKFAVKVSLAPGFASYSQSQPAPTEANPNPQPRRNFNFSATANLSGDVRLTPHFAIRTSLEQMLIRYKSTMRDPPGIGTPPRLSFLSHDNYINSTNWGVTVGPVFRF